MSPGKGGRPEERARGKGTAAGPGGTGDAEGVHCLSPGTSLHLRRDTASTMVGYEEPALSRPCRIRREAEPRAAVLAPLSRPFARPLLRTLSYPLPTFLLDSLSLSFVICRCPFIYDDYQSSALLYVAKGCT